MRVLSFKPVTFAEDRLREAEFWTTKSIAERVKAGWELAENDLFQRKADREQTERTAITFRRIERGRR